MKNIMCSQVMSPKDLNSLATSIGYLAVACKIARLEARTFLEPKEKNLLANLKQWWGENNDKDFDVFLDELLMGVNPEFVL